MQCLCNDNNLWYFIIPFYFQHSFIILYSFYSSFICIKSIFNLYVIEGKTSKCPATMFGMAEFGEVSSPSDQNNVRRVFGKCITNSINLDATAPYMDCLWNGKWNSSHSSSCVCKSGYEKLSGKCSSKLRMKDDTNLSCEFINFIDLVLFGFCFYCNELNKVLGSKFCY